MPYKTTKEKVETRREKVRRLKTNIFVNRQIAYGGGEFTDIYYRKLLVYGDFLELHTFGQVQMNKSLTDAEKRARRLLSVKGKNGKKKRADNVARTRQNVYRLVEANTEKDVSQFFTLTFRENIQDTKKANAIFRNFIRRVSYHFGIHVKYIVVLEFQKRGAIHYHGIFFNVPEMTKKDLQALWLSDSPQVDIEYPKGIRSVGAYIAKYIGKDLNDVRLFDTKAYLTSRNLKRPVITTDDDTIDFILQNATMEEIAKVVNLRSEILKYRKYE
jgi:hypothetical protein